VYVVEDSDIMFTIKLVQIINGLKNVKLLMIGSCGIDSDWESFQSRGDIEFKNPISKKLKSDNNLILNDSFWVNEAIKSDRGVMTSRTTLDGKHCELLFTLRDDKTVKAQINGNNLIIGKKSVIYSSNFLSNTSIKDNKIYDMESYDFIKICEALDVKCLGIIRCITDICSHPLNKMIRVFSTMESSTQMFLENIHLLTNPIIDKKWELQLTKSEDVDKKTVEILKSLAIRSVCDEILSIFYSNKNLIKSIKSNDVKYDLIRESLIELNPLILKLLQDKLNDGLIM